jgi:Legume lectin domain/PEP-CTERM motif
MNAMKANKFFPLVVGTGSIVLATASAVNATTLKFTDFSDLSDLTLNGSAETINNGGGVFFNGQNVLRLTNDLGQSGNAFVSDPISLTNDRSFSTAFSFQITDPQGISDNDGQGADGIAFVLQTLSNTVGGGGGSIGYGGISPSIGIEFDTYNNTAGGIPESGNHVGINLNGSLFSVAQQDVIPRMNNGGVWYSWIDYDGISDLLEVRLSQTAARPKTALLSYTVDLASILGSSDAYVGFTSGTGAAGGDHDIRSWTFKDTYDPIDVPEPSSVLGFLTLGALGIGSRLRRRK